jgi:hypothetical protein
MHTEEQAKKLWCPKAMVLDENGVSMASGNRGLGSMMSRECLCLASGCAAWRWVPVTDTSALNPDYKDKSPRQGY